MLINLHVKNLALIEETEVDFTDHLNIPCLLAARLLIQLVRTL